MEWRKCTQKSGHVFAIKAVYKYARDKANYLLIFSGGKNPQKNTWV